jgi:hypothetical protein
VTERVEPYEILGSPLLWEPNAPEAVLMSDDQGRAALALRAHPDDLDQSCVVLRWRVVRYSLMGSPNDEALHMHRLYHAGLKDVLWVGVVRESQLVATLRPMGSPHQMFVPHHYVVVSKECVVEVVAEDLDVLRFAGSTRDAALTSLSR